MSSFPPPAKHTERQLLSSLKVALTGVTTIGLRSLFINVWDTEQNVNIFFYGVINRLFVCVMLYV